jgi:protein-S-isoprenylcysteine O-methyltransferase Ste14
MGINKIYNDHQRWLHFINLDIIIILLYILWLLYESKISIHDIKDQSAISDHGTGFIYGFSQSLTILSALYVTSIWKTPGIYHFIGLIIFIFGVMFRLWAIATLGRYYSHVVRKSKKHRIIDTGPYRFLRHPAYTGMIIAHIGITLFYFNFITLAMILLFLIPSIILRITIEEKMLFTIKGYKDFAMKRKRILPYIW